jgi:pilus assembly protein Flp/PilA
MTAMKTKISKLIGRFAREDSGATAIEYALIASTISIAILGAVIALGNTVKDDLFGRVLAALKG